MNKLFAYIIISLFFISFTSALTISPNSLSVTQQLNEQKNYTLNITNTLNVPIFGFQFSNMSQFGFSFPETNMSANSTKLINITFNPTISFSGQVNSLVSFKFNANIPTEITTYNLNITSNGFSNTFLIIRQGDTVTWKNLDTIVHRVNSTLFDSNLISSTGTFSFTFNQLGTFNYTDPSWQEFSGFKGSVQVIDRNSQEQIHNPNHDIIMVFNLVLSSKPTILETELIESIFKVDALGQTDGLIRIKNIGNETATNVKITSNSNWINPKENDFSLTPNQQKFVAYTISPIIFETADTNKNYTINISVKGLNTDSISKQINVFIPFNDDFDDPSSGTGIASAFQKALERLIEFCQNNPSQCGNSTTQGNNSQNANFSINETQKGYEQNKRNIAEIQTDTEQNKKDLSELKEQYANLFNINNSSSESLRLQLENRERITTWTWVVIILVSFFFLFKIIGKAISNYREKKGLEAYQHGRLKVRGQI